MLTGCSSQADPGRYRDFPGIDILTGNKSNTELPAAIQQYIADGTARGVIPHEKGDEFRGTGITRFEEHTRAFVKIQDGCDRFCSYCIIPAARGRSRSRKPDSIEAELRALAANGYREIVLTGINLSDYGKGSELTLADAVRLCENIEGICRVRLGSLEPDHITDTLIEALRSCAKLCGHFHISLQSGSDRTLKAMNRHYTAREYLELCEKLRNSFDGCAITTDIMVGMSSFGKFQKHKK